MQSSSAVYLLQPLPFPGCSLLPSPQPQHLWDAPLSTTILHQKDVSVLPSSLSPGKVLFLPPSPFLAAPFFHASSYPPFCFLHRYYSHYCSYHRSLTVACIFPLLSSFSLLSIRALPTLGFLLLFPRTPSCLFFYFPSLVEPPSPFLVLLEGHLFCCNPGQKPPSHSAN